MPSTKQAPGFVTQQLSLGAYWDAVPPFYSMTTLPGPALNTGQESAFPKWQGRHPITIPNDLAAQLFWQVAEYNAKLEFNLKETVEGYTVNCQDFRISTEDNKFLETWDLGTLTENQSGIIAAQNFESRELKLPQGDLKWIKTVRKDFTDEIPAGSTQQYPYISLVTENYATLQPAAIQQVTSAWDAGGIGAFKAYDIAAEIYFDRGLVFSTEKNKASASINSIIAEELGKLTLMRVSNQKTKYYDLKRQIDAQFLSFQQWSQQLSAEAQQELEEAQTDYDALSEPPPEDPEGEGAGPSPAQEKQFAIRAIRIGETYKNKIKLRALLEWFWWENGFEKELDFPEYAKHRMLAPWGFFNAAPPSLSGAFVGACSSVNKDDETIQDFNLVIDLPFKTIQFGLTKEFESEVKFQSNDTIEEEVEYQVENKEYPQCKYTVDGAKLQLNFPNYPTTPIDWKNADPLSYCVENRDAEGNPDGTCAIVDGYNTPYGDNYYVTYCIPIYTFTGTKYTQKYPQPVDLSSLGTEQQSSLSGGTGNVGIEISFNLQDLAFNTQRAQAKLNFSANGGFYGGIYIDVLTGPNYPEQEFYQELVTLEDFYDTTTFTKKPEPTFPEYPPLEWYLPATPFTDTGKITHNLNTVVYSGEYLSDNAAGAEAQFDALVTDCTKMREPNAPVEEKGVFQIKDKQGATLFECPMYGKTLIPVQNLVLSYTIKRFNWEPPEPPPEEDPDLID